ncbi:MULTISPECIES: hypothetical protein [Lelliottia]|uniref:Uncharacterized protein n=1 Tax=Lelliottia aquatilis TaxID=2080838 RepID=A0ABX4ZYE1_9ENTR|nr:MULTISPECIES: hypothetical protein [Lelliottia]POZ16234.1 hypothetical protein C3708_20150 [Lelliottia sp. 7254-16]POZ20548.1 hypothetical protein C3712_18215 [Lelliottia aquatilis]POZ22055.1 hypothetical protein C3711_18960 [Lelliottia aquatilis]POZ33099.1 hypothetical protein C3710_10130 [Lelliottia aquatilis]POZ38239.1 hypothetical protein C3709_11905 [Lelliottia aquatilis]
MRYKLIGKAEECLNVAEAPCNMLERMHKAISQLKSEYISALGLLSNIKYSANNKKFNVVEIGTESSERDGLICSISDIPMSQGNIVHFVLITALCTRSYALKSCFNIDVCMYIKGRAINVILNKENETMCYTAYEHAGGFGPICDAIIKHIKLSIDMDLVDYQLWGL